jgi:hypothetical protein
MVSHGLAAPWNLHPRVIPFPRLQPTNLTAVHNIRSTESREVRDALLGCGWKDKSGILLPKGTTHHVEFGVDYHTTAYVTFRFARPPLVVAGSPLPGLRVMRMNLSNSRLTERREIERTRHGSISSGMSVYARWKIVCMTAMKLSLL